MFPARPAGAAPPRRGPAVFVGLLRLPAGLAAGGTTEIEEIGYIERGYEDLVEKLRRLGADIARVSVEEPAIIPKAN